MIRVYLVDDSEIFRLGTTALMAPERALRVVGGCDSARLAPARVAAAAADMVIMDSELRDGSGIELCAMLCAMRPRPQCIIHSGDDSQAAFLAAVRAGASGYVLKRGHPSKLVDTVIRVARGGELLRPDRNEPIPPSAGDRETAEQPSVGLSLRESQILRLITRGMTNRQIAAVLTLSEKTVKNYMSGLLMKLGMDSRTQAAVYGATHDIEASGAVPAHRRS
jgi:two-component system response regulator DevR